jgi:quinol monooxygenase YgiN
MVHVALLARLEAKPGKEAEVADLLKSALPLANAEPATTVWFALKLGPSTFGIFDAFPDDAGRQAHLSGQIAAALMAKAPELLAKSPTIEPVDVLAAKLPQT